MSNILNESHEIILSLISEGKENAKYIRDISASSGLCHRDIKSIIQDLRKMGYPVCSSTYDGIWLAKDRFELNETIKQFESRQIRINETLQALYDIQRNL